MNRKPTPLTPNALPLAEALGRSAALTSLRARLADSDARFEAIRAAVPAGLLPHLRPGPVDDGGWSLLAANAAVASKLRQLQPRLEETLRTAGWATPTIRIRILPSRP